MRLPLIGLAVPSEATPRFRVQTVKFACLLCAAALQHVRVEAQSTSDSTSVGSPPSQTVVVDSTNLTANSNAYVIRERGPNHRVWQRITSVTNRLGEVSYETNGGYTELATGMHHLVNGQWVESSDAILITAAGGVATNCQHQVAFTANINTTGAIDLTMPDGNHLQSHILGLSYLDPTTGQYVLIASLKDSIGQVVGAGSNQVIYADAFNGGFKADVVYRNTKAGFEQNIVIREQLPSPASYNLNPTNTRLQVMTEFLNPPTAQVTQAQMTNGTTVDQVVDFGQMSIGQGHAFSMGSDSTDPANGLPVNKHWLLLNSRRVLVEDVPFPKIVPQLMNLPAPSTGSSTNQGADAGGLLHRVFAQVQLPPAPKQVKRPNAAMKLATLPSSDKGFVLDYGLVVNGTTNLTFQADTTYYVSGAANLNGTTVIEGGAVIKYTNSSSATIVASSVTCATGPYRMAVFTSVDDNSVGESLGTGTPVNTGATYLQLSSSATDLRYLRMLYAGIGIRQVSTSDTTQRFAVTIWHSQFVKCQNALGNMAYNDGYFQQTLLNVLISQCTVGLTNLGTSYGNGSHLALNGENLTVDQVPTLLYTHGWTDSYPYASTSLKNSILTGVQYQIQRPTGDWDYDDEGDIVTMATNQDIPMDHCAAATIGSGIFQAAGAGNYYLADGSTNRNAGTTASSVLVRDLNAKTTYPPLVYSNVTINTNLPLSAQVPRNSGAPDRGYHYDPIDYAFGHVTVTNAALTLVPGTVIGTFGIGSSDYGLSIGTGGQMISVGSPANLCHIVTYDTVQEEPGTNVWQLPGNASVTDAAGGTGGTFAFRFTDWSMLASPSSCHINLSYDPVNFQDCQFHGAAINTWYPTINLTNCLLERVKVSLSPEDADTTMVCNNLFYGGRLDLLPFGSHHAVVRDNLFDHTTIIDYSGFYTYTGGYNAYVTNWTNWNRMKPTMSSDRLLTNSPVYQAGPLGNYYEPANSPLTNVGSTNADLVGLYHYTTQTSEVKETNSVVDIGYHYVAVNGSGVPLDFNSDGIPDYLEDANGNGTVQGDERSWTYIELIHFSAGNMNYTIGSPPTIIDGGATITNPTCSSLNGGSLTVSIVTNRQPEDVLAINNQGTGSNQIGVNSTSVTYGGTTIGTFTGGTGTNSLVITFNSNASTNAVQALVRNLTYRYYPTTNESSLTRTVQFVLVDCGAQTSVPFTKTITLNCPSALNVVLVIDRSSSMDEALTNDAQTKIGAAEITAENFVSGLQLSSVQVGLVTFASTATTVSILTTNESAVISGITNISLGSGTGTSNGIAVAQGLFPSNTTTPLPVMVLLTDGVPTNPTNNPVDAAISAANTAKAAGIRLITIGFGSPGNDFNPDLLQALASTTDDYHSATNSSVLQSIYNAVAESVCLPVPPGVTLTSPTNTQLFAFSPTNFLLQATASTGVINVSFYNGTNLLGNSISPPYQFLWTDVGAGSYTLSATATDSNGLTGNSFPVGVVVNGMPVVSILGPTNDQVFPEVAGPTLRAVARDPEDGTNVQVKFYSRHISTTNLIGPGASGTTTNIGGPTFGVFSNTWSGRSAGLYPIMAVATDSRGASNVSGLKVFKVTPASPPPVVNITSPVHYAIFNAWPDVKITANAYSASGISNVTFYNGTTVLGTDTTATVVAGATNYEITLHGLQPGSYSFTAKATDNLNHSSTSAVVVVAVRDGPTLPAGYWDPEFGNIVRLDADYGAVNAIQFDSQDNLYAATVPSLTGVAGSGYLLRSSCSWLQRASVNADAGQFTSFLLDGTNLYVGGIAVAYEGSDSVSPSGEIGIRSGAQVNGIGDGLQQPGTFPNFFPPVGSVEAIHVFNGDVYIGGYFIGTHTLAPPDPVNTGIQYVAKLAGSSSTWTNVDASTNHLNGAVRAIADFNGQLYVGGEFTAAGINTNVHYLARLVNGDWQPVGGGVDAPVWALTAHNGRLFVGGLFTNAGGTTNGSLIACWDGTNLSGINRGLNNGSVGGAQPWFMANVVTAIAARGDEIYVTGHFGTAWNGTNALTVNNIARAFLNETNQTWQWSALGSGLDYIGDFSSSSQADGSSILIRDLDNNGGYEVIMGGSFDTAGGVNAIAVARWLVGQSECPTNGPYVEVYGGGFVPYGSFGCIEDGAGGGFIPLYAGAASTGTNTITNVDFILDGIFLTNITSGSQKFGHYGTEFWVGENCNGTNFSVGLHTIQAKAYDSAGLTALSQVLPFVWQPNGNSGPSVNDATYHVTSSGTVATTNLLVLTNDSSSYLPMHIVGLRTNQYLNPLGTNATAGGTFSNSADHTYLIYTANPNSFGVDVASYDVADSNGTNSTSVTVYVTPQAQLQIIQPASGSSVVSPADFNIVGAIYAPRANYSVVQISVNGVPFGSPIIPDDNGGFSIPWKTLVPGTYTFVAMASDANNNNIGASAPATLTVTANTGGGGGSGNYSTSGPNPPTAAITSPTPPVINTGGGLFTNSLVLTDGVISNFVGSAYSAGGGSALWQIILLDPRDPYAPPLYNITPGSRDANGFHSSAVSSASFGTLDLSMVENGQYTLILFVKSSGGQASAQMSVTVESNLKIGQFGFSEQDLVVPVNGIPLTVTRTYNSINPRSGDFGFGWTYALNSMDVSLDENREEIEIGGDSFNTTIDGSDPDTGQFISVRTGGSRDVTLTLPNGRRTTFVFTPRFGAGTSAYYAEWTAAADVHASLVPLGGLDSEIINIYPSLGWQGNSASTYDNYDIPGWILTTQDGTQFYITRQAKAGMIYDDPNNPGSGNLLQTIPYGPPKLTQITQRTGDMIVITDDGLTHWIGTNATRSLIFQRDVQGRITAINDPVGGPKGFPAVQYVYDPNTGNLSQVLKLLDRNYGTYVTNTMYQYTNASFPHYITAIKNASGLTPLRTIYDASGRMTGTVDAFGKTNSFTHDINARTETINDRLGNPTTYYYDVRGNVTNAMDAYGVHTQKGYDATNNLIMEADALGNTNYYGYDNLGNRIASTNALGFTNGFVYNTNSQLTVSTDARGFSSTNFYDPNSGNLTGTMDALGRLTTNYYNLQNLQTGSSNEIGTFTTNIYDGSGNMVSNMTFVVVSGATNILSSSSFAYDANGNQTNQTVWRHDAVGTWVGAPTTMVYDGQNRLTQTIDALGKTNTTVYNANGQVQATIDKLGRTNSFAYDDQGQLLQTTYPDGTTNLVAYDADSRRTITTNQLGQVTTYHYDLVGRLGQTVYADLSSNSTVYDAAGRVASTIDALGTFTTNMYDSSGNMVSNMTFVMVSGTTNILGSSGFAFDANGNQTNMVDALGRTNTFVYDRLNRVTTNIFPDSTTQVTVYDAGGRKVASVDQANKTNLFQYDGVGRLITVTNALQKWTQYAYDEAGNQVSQTDARTHMTTFEYDALGRRTKRTLPYDGTNHLVETFGYDGNGNMLAHTNFNGLALTNNYDSMNRLMGRWNGSTQLEGFTYTDSGQRKTMTDASGTTTYTYDNRDRLATKTVAWTSGPSITLTYLYDNNGSVTNIASSTSSGFNMYYRYDALSRMTNVLDNGAAAAAYEYDAVGNLSAMQYGNGVTNQYTYDTLNRLKGLTWKTNGASKQIFTYTLGPAGNRTNLVELLNSTVCTYRWQYDDTYRLMNETIVTNGLTNNAAYTYDDVGNRSTRTLSGPGTLGSLTNQSFTFNVDDLVGGETYDQNGNTQVGNLASGVLPSATHKDAYDAEDRLVLRSNGGTNVTLVYDGDGNRVKKTVGTVTTYYLVEDRNPTGYAQVAEEWVGSGSPALSRVYAMGLELISQRIIGMGTYFYVYDGHGSVRALTDTNGLATDTYRYDAYGTLIARTGSTANNILFAGEQWDGDLGMYVNRARYLNQNMGRFWSMDNYEGGNIDPMSLHRYLYSFDDPVDFADPSGNIPILSNWIYGNQVQREIAFDFLAFGPPGAKTPPLYTPISTILGVRYIPGLTASRPDLVLLPGSRPGAPGQIWEIKPAGSFVEGTAQLWFYLTILNYWDKTHRWTPGSTYVPPSVIPLDFGVYAFVTPSVGGVILYHVEDVRLDIAILVMVAVKLQVPELIFELAL